MSLKSLRVKNFTAFSDLEVEFSPGLNVIIGENAAGKSHLLKLAYVTAYVVYESSRREKKLLGEIPAGTDKSSLQRRIAEKLVGVFKPDTLGRLSRRGRGRARSQVRTDFGTDGALEFSFASNSSKDVALLSRPPEARHDAPIFFPTKEVLSLYPGLTSLYETRELAIDETYYDLCKFLSAPLLRGKYSTGVAAIVQPLAKIMGGNVRMSSGRFYLRLPGQGFMEIPLVAEGFRKLAMLAYLAANGSLTDKGMLFWDEPEANLNPKIITLVAESLATLVRGGVQVIAATHSLFFMKELSYLVERSKKGVPARFFGLRIDRSEVKLEHGELLEDLQTITALDEVLSQDDREQALFQKGMQ
ncbi:MAG: AAA family ATPase [Thermodesulfobacteriota bacterium]